MADVLLLPMDDAALELASEDPAAWASHHSLDVGPVAALVGEVARRTREFARRAGAESDWGGFLAADAASRAVIGTCAFKGPPDGGVVEIAYFTFPPFEGRGYATAMAAALAGRAIGGDEVRTIRAHTLPERNASARVLEKLGFELKGEVVDPEDGPVWCWERAAGGG